MIDRLGVTVVNRAASGMRLSYVELRKYYSRGEGVPGEPLCSKSTAEKYNVHYDKP
jgi:hypothetical protein